MRESLIVVVCVIHVLASPAVAGEARCPPKAIAALDGRGLQRHQPFDETHPLYDCRKTSMAVDRCKCFCVGHADVIVGVNTANPSKSFMAFLVTVARDVTGADASRAIAAYRSALAHKGTKEECMPATLSPHQLFRSTAVLMIISRPSAFSTSA